MFGRIHRDPSDVAGPCEVYGWIRNLWLTTTLSHMRVFSHSSFQTSIFLHLTAPPRPKAQSLCPSSSPSQPNAQTLTQPTAAALSPYHTVVTDSLPLTRPEKFAPLILGRDPTPLLPLLPLLAVKVSPSLTTTTHITTNHGAHNTKVAGERPPAPRLQPPAHHHQALR